MIDVIDFEYDSRKSASNLVKHGISFEDAINLWHDQGLLEIPARNTDEPRFLVIGMINNRHWSAITTYRGKKIRIISVRRSRKSEVELYESERFR